MDIQKKTITYTINETVEDWIISGDFSFSSEGKSVKLGVCAPNYLPIGTFRCTEYGEDMLKYSYEVYDKENKTKFINICENIYENIVNSINETESSLQGFNNTPDEA